MLAVPVAQHAADLPALQVLDGLQSGTVECGQTASLYYVGKDPTFAAFTAIPFGMNMRQMTAWLRHGGGNEIATELYRDYNVVGIPFGDRLNQRKSGSRLVPISYKRRRPSASRRLKEA